MVLPPTDPSLAEPDTRPYFSWWTDETVGGLRQRLASSAPAERAYWLGALLREANTRDVWMFVTPNRFATHGRGCSATSAVAVSFGVFCSTWIPPGLPSMRAELDRRVIPEVIIDLVRAVQAREPAHLAGGVALSGAHLAHRLSADVDLFVHDAQAHRRACVHLSDAVKERNGTLVVVQGRPRARVG